MTHITRRDLLSTGLALSATSLSGRSAWARTAGMLDSAMRNTRRSSFCDWTREQLLFDFGWKFTFAMETTRQKISTSDTAERFFQDRKL